jgi:ABC-type transport system involved in multi-copper enzyme maturation permease subunit
MSTAALLMPLLRRTLSQARYVLCGCLILLCGFQLVIIGQAAAIEQQNAFSRMSELVPAFLHRGLGSRAMLLATFRGTVAFGYFHPVVVMMVAVLALYLATEPAHEVEAGLVDLELSRSIPRHAIVTRSLIGAMTSIVVATLLMGLGTYAGLRLFAASEFDVPPAAVFAQLLMHLGSVAAVFAALGLALAAGARRWSTAFFTAVLIAVLLYLIDFLSIGWPFMRSVAWISPFRYYPALAILAGDAPALRNIVILLSAAAVLAAVGYWRFSRRDL